MLVLHFAPTSHGIILDGHDSNARHVCDNAIVNMRVYFVAPYRVCRVPCSFTLLIIKQLRACTMQHGMLNADLVYIEHVTPFEQVRRKNKQLIVRCLLQIVGIVVVQCINCKSNRIEAQHCRSCCISSLLLLSLATSLPLQYYRSQVVAQKRQA